MDIGEKTKLLSRMRRMLDEAFGARLKGVVLFGSFARGDETPDSDIDLLVLLEGPINLWRDLGKGTSALYPLVLELGHPIHPLPVDLRDYEAQEFPVYRNAKREGLAA